MTFIVSIGFVGLTLGISSLAGKALEVIARNRGATGRISSNMFVGIAVSEALSILVIVFGLIIKFM